MSEEPGGFSPPTKAIRRPSRDHEGLSAAATGTRSMRGEPPDAGTVKIRGWPRSAVYRTNAMRPDTRDTSEPADVGDARSVSPAAPAVPATNARKSEGRRFTPR